MINELVVDLKTIFVVSVILAAVHAFVALLLTLPTGYALIVAALSFVIMVPVYFVVILVLVLLFIAGVLCIGGFAVLALLLWRRAERCRRKV